MSNSLWLTELRKEIEMAKTSGGVRSKSSSRSSGGNYQASVAVENRRGETRWLQKNFRTQKQAEQWIDRVASRFDSPAKSGFATTAAIDKDTKRGTQYDIYNRDLAREFEVKDKREFRAGRGGYTGRR
ncbi:hypothetical protein [uncultured Bacteroides sp.]|uniref:hypothetical protein n=1 Tax=uncultured Bacteroides sp. TaxID=162156 RepID=UPI002675B734|nr:hypothetical protein [uncultured Bacteroides sp.]